MASHKWLREGHGFQPCRPGTQEFEALAAEASLVSTTEGFSPPVEINDQRFSFDVSRVFPGTCPTPGRFVQWNMKRRQISVAASVAG
jgi:hypothetical protein